jgi:hypothetical protein
MCPIMIWLRGDPSSSTRAHQYSFCWTTVLEQFPYPPNPSHSVR